MCVVRVPSTTGCGACPAATAFSWTLPCRSSLARIRICDRQDSFSAPADHLAPPAIQVHILPCVPKPALDSPAQAVIRLRRRSRSVGRTGAPTEPNDGLCGAVQRRFRDARQDMDLYSGWCQVVSGRAETVLPIADPDPRQARSTRQCPGEGGSRGARPAPRGGRHPYNTHLAGCPHADSDAVDLIATHSQVGQKGALDFVRDPLHEPDQAGADRIGELQHPPR